MHTKPRDVLASLSELMDALGVGVTVWFFHRVRPGQLRPWPLRRFEAFSRGDQPMAPGPDGFVEYAQVVVELENRRAVDIGRVGFFKHRVTAEGKFDRDHLFDVMATATEVISGPMIGVAAEPGIIEAGHRFAPRRLENLSHWKPSDAERRALRELVNARARRVIWPEGRR